MIEGRVGRKEWALISFILILLLGAGLYRFRYQPVARDLVRQKQAVREFKWPQEEDQELRRLEEELQKVERRKQATEAEVQRLLGGFARNEAERARLLSEISNLAERCGLKVKKSVFPFQAGASTNSKEYPRLLFMERMKAAGLQPRPVLKISARVSFKGLAAFAKTLSKLQHRVMLVQFEIQDGKPTVEASGRAGDGAAEESNNSAAGEMLDFSALLAL